MSFGFLQLSYTLKQLEHRHTQCVGNNIECVDSGVRIAILDSA